MFPLRFNFGLESKFGFVEIHSCGHLSAQLLIENVTENLFNPMLYPGWSVRYK